MQSSQQLCLFPEVHLNKVHHSGIGYITLVDSKDNWKENYFLENTMNQAVNDYTGNDIFTSQNSFSCKYRSARTISRLENLFSDLDFYTKGFTAEQALDAIKYYYENGDIPQPHIIVFSGRGIQLTWNIKAETKDKLPMWQQTMDWLNEELQHLGADAKATDAARVLRLAGTYNSKNGKIVCAIIYNHQQFNLQEIYQKYVPPPKQKEQKKNITKQPSKGTVKRLFNKHSLFWARMQDLWKLVSVRKGRCSGHRESILFLYRYHSCIYTKDAGKALEDTIELNKRFTEPLPLREVANATKSAEKAFKTDKVYKFKNATLIDMLEITEEEQREMQTIIGKKEKQKRQTIKRNKGVNTAKIRKVMDAYEKGITGIRAIARETGVNKDTVSRYLKIILS